MPNKLPVLREVIDFLLRLCECAYHTRTGRQRIGRKRLSLLVPVGCTRLHRRPRKTRENIMEATTTFHFRSTPPIDPFSTPLRTYGRFSEPWRVDFPPFPLPAGTREGRKEVPYSLALAINKLIIINRPIQIECFSP